MFFLRFHITIQHFLQFSHFPVVDSNLALLLLIQSSINVFRRRSTLVLIVSPLSPLLNRRNFHFVIFIFIFQNVFTKHQLTFSKAIAVLRVALYTLRLRIVFTILSTQLLPLPAGRYSRWEPPLLFC